MNSIASQEFGSDFTDTYDARGFSAGWSLARFGWRPSLDVTYERQDPLLVHAQPATRAFEPAIPAISLRETREALAFERPTVITVGGVELAAKIAFTGIHVSFPTDARADLLRPFVLIDLQK